MSESFVKQFVPDGHALGRVVRQRVAPGEPEPAYEIVGVVKDTKLMALRDAVEPMVYVASTQERDPGNETQFIVRARRSLAATLPAVTRALAEFSPGVNVEFRVLTKTIRDALLRERLMASLAGAFGVLAALLAAIGLYGLLAYTVARRSSEIGIRLAMGANRRDVVLMVLRETVWLVIGGAIAGTGLALAGAQFARALLFQLNPTDPATVASAVALLACIGLLAGAVPARRASRVDPAVALRDE